MGCNGNKEGIGLQGVSYCCNVDSRGGGGPRVSRRVIECRKVLRRSTIGNWGIDITSCLFLRMHHRGIAVLPPYVYWREIDVSPHVSSFRSP